MTCVEICANTGESWLRQEAITTKKAQAREAQWQILLLILTQASYPGQYTQAPQCKQPRTHHVKWLYYPPSPTLLVGRYSPLTTTIDFFSLMRI